MNIYKQDFQLISYKNRWITADCICDPHNCKGIIVFCHGLKGFKDWGYFNLAARKFAEGGYAFIKFNFSHNGTSPDALTEFVDLEAFGNNNFSIEQYDLDQLLNFLGTDPFYSSMLDNAGGKIYLIGHSRGGGAAILKASSDKRVKGLITWASVVEFGRFWSSEFLAQWKADGVAYIDNSRTHQKMPMYWQIFDDYYKRKNELFIPKAIQDLAIPYLAIHGSGDKVVSPNNLEEIAKLNESATTLLIEEADHSFGGAHPWNIESLPKYAELLVLNSLNFLHRIN